VRIPGHFVHPFRSNPYSDSDVFVHPGEEDAAGAGDVAPN